MRLERSFRDQELLPQLVELAFGRQLAGLILLLGRSMKDSGDMVAADLVRRGVEAPSWFDDPVAYAAAMKAAEHALRAFQPKPRGRPRDQHDETAIAFGDLYAEGVLNALKFPDSVRRKIGGAPTDLADWTERVRKLLGDTVKRITVGGPVAFAPQPPAAPDDADGADQ